MLKQIEKLKHVASKNERIIIGLMSGTSLDGLDIALCKVAGSGHQTHLELLHFITQNYSEEYRSRIRAVFSRKIVDLQQLCALNAWIGQLHAQLINDALKRWNITATEVDIIASHGQTVYHAPQSLTNDMSWPNSTLQIGDGDHIAVQTGIITISDFRQKHVAAGGEGAPLAAYGDTILFSDDTEDRVLLNIGGISNFTFLPNRNSKIEAFATDIGPGNTLMNQYMFQQYHLEMDTDAKVALSGFVDEKLLAALLKESFLGYCFPKTTGPELFNLDLLSRVQKETKTTHLPVENVMATLCHFTAESIIEAINRLHHHGHLSVYISGGGIHNPLLLELIKKGLPDIKVSLFNELGLNGDAKEACLFALLANESLSASDTDYRLQNSPNICMGKISLPH